jgi:hypothetical protein
MYAQAHPVMDAGPQRQHCSPCVPKVNRQISGVASGSLSLVLAGKHVGARLRVVILSCRQRPLELPQSLTERTTSAGQTLGAKDQESNAEYENEVGGLK